MPRRPRRPRPPRQRTRPKCPKPLKPQRPAVRPARKPRKPAALPAPAAVLPHDPGRPGNNTTCDVYLSPNVPPAAPDTAGAACHLRAEFRDGAEGSEGDATFRWTHVLYVDDAVDVRDSYPNAPAHRVYVPDKNGTGFDVVFVERVRRGVPGSYKRVFLDRRQPAWPTSEL
jgi:hypothetical protein